MDQQTKQQLLRELQQKFDQMKKESGFKSTFKQIEQACFLQDMVLSTGYVSEQFSRSVLNRFVDMYYSWVPVIHSWIMPPQYDLIYLNENKQINEKEREELKDIVKVLMYFVRKNKRIAYDDKKSEGEFLDELVDYHKSTFKKFIFNYNKKFEKYWEKEKNN